MLKESCQGLAAWYSVWCLNPYFNGTCSKRFTNIKATRNGESLNPYFNGTCSKRACGCDQQKDKARS